MQYIWHFVQNRIYIVQKIVRVSIEIKLYSYNIAMCDKISIHFPIFNHLRNLKCAFSS